MKKKTKTKTKYTKPVITAVKLDPSQAILQTCQVGGVLFWDPTMCVGGNGATTPTTLVCSINPRGATGATEARFTGTAQPS